MYVLLLIYTSSRLSLTLATFLSQIAPIICRHFDQALATQLSTDKYISGIPKINLVVQNYAQH